MQRGRGVREWGRTKPASPDPGGCGGILCAEEAAVSGTGLVAQGTDSSGTDSSGTVEAASSLAYCPAVILTVPSSSFGPFPEPASPSFPSDSGSPHVALQYISFTSAGVGFFFCLQRGNTSETIYNMLNALLYAYASPVLCIYLHSHNLHKRL